MHLIYIPFIYKTGFMNTALQLSILKKRNDYLIKNCIYEGSIYILDVSKFRPACSLIPSVSFCFFLQFSYFIIFCQKNMCG